MKIHNIYNSVLVYKKYILFLIVSILLLTGCTDNLFYDGMSADVLKGELPVDFDCYVSDVVGTRGFEEGTNVKTSFDGGDVIHVVGVFETKKLTGSKDKEGNDEYEYGTQNRYGALMYNSKERKWLPLDGSQLTWPSTAMKGKFYAYYINGSNGLLTNDEHRATEIKMLSDITPATDPLTATSADDIEYGRAVKLNFNHICTHLTLIDLEPMVASSYFFKRDDVQDFNNAFRLTLGKDDKEQDALMFEFIQQPDTSYGDMVYISADAIEAKSIDENNVEKTITKANYFLQPGDYYQFSLSYPATASSTYPYLKYDYNSIPENVGGVGVTNIPPRLDAGTTYTLTITKSPGVTIVAPPDADGWDDAGIYYDVDVEEFLKAVCTKNSYYYDADTQILETTATGTRLLHNVNFEFNDYSEFKDPSFVPNISEDNVFDGDHHYISNLGSPLFRYNYGQIQNVGINTIKFTAVSRKEGDDNDKMNNIDKSRYGALCMWNRGNATISNVRVSDVDMTIKVSSDITADDNTSETHNIGCVLGSNTGKVNGVALSGKFKLTVQNDDGKADVNVSVLIGGFVGQNAGEAEVTDVSPLDNTMSVEIINECKGEIGSYSVGGVVGESSGIISDVIFSNMSIDGSKSDGITSYMGGIAGQLLVSDNLSHTAKVTSCSVGGSVKAGKVHLHDPLTTVSYIGGLVGADLGVPVTDCNASVSVNCSQEAVAGGIYAIGGAFGRIRDASDYTFGDIIAYGNALKGPSNSQVEGVTSYIGNFAGVVPSGQTWDNDYSDKNILVRKYTDIKDIGAALNSSNQKDE